MRSPGSSVGGLHGTGHVREAWQTKDGGTTFELGFLDLALDVYIGRPMSEWHRRPKET